jgi:hypothetical protein
MAHVEHGRRSGIHYMLEAVNAEVDRRETSLVELGDKVTQAIVVEELYRPAAVNGRLDEALQIRSERGA